MTWQNLHKFTISEHGAKTGEDWRGQFSAKILLSHGDELALDRRRKELLGGDPAGSSADAVTRASILAELMVRIVDAPPWWVASRSGVDIIDEEPILALYKECMRAEREHAEGLQKKAAEAAEKLKAVQAADAPPIPSTTQAG